MKTMGSREPSSTASKAIFQGNELSVEEAQSLPQGPLQRGLEAPNSLTPRHIMALQGSVGNRAVSRMLTGTLSVQRQPLTKSIQPQRQEDENSWEATPVVHPQQHPSTPRLNRSLLKTTATAKTMIQRAAGNIKSASLIGSNFVHWYTKEGTEFQQTPRKVRKGVNLVDVRNSGDEKYVWARTDQGEEGYLRKKNLTIDTINPAAPPSYTDRNKLLKVQGDPAGGSSYQSKDTEREWFLDQAILMEAYRSLDSTKDVETRKQLALAMLQSFAKGATVDLETEERLGLQTSPFSPARMAGYHRSTDNPLLLKVLGAITKAIGLNESVARLVADPGILQVLARKYSVYSSQQDGPGDGNEVITEIDSVDTFKASVERIFLNVEAGHPPQGPFVLNLTGLYKSSGVTPADFVNVTTPQLEREFITKAKAFMDRRPELKAEAMKVFGYIQVVALAKHGNTDVLLIPTFLARSSKKKSTYSPEEEALFDQVDQDKHMRFMSGKGEDEDEHTIAESLDHAMVESGYRLDPMTAKRAWLDVSTPEEILKQGGFAEGIPVTELGTRGKMPAKVVEDIHAFMAMGLVKRFKDLSIAPNAAPYLTIYPIATYDMLKGLAEVNVLPNTLNTDTKDLKTRNRGGSVVGKGEKSKQGLGRKRNNSTTSHVAPTSSKPVGIDDVFAAKKITAVLQIAYYRMLNSMGTAILHKDDLPKFMNEIEVIHQQMQMILAIVQPHTRGTFAKGIQQALSEPTSSGKPTVPQNLGTPKVHHKASAMHSLASILSSMEMQKGSNKLNVLVTEDNYYEASLYALQQAKSYDLNTLKGDNVREDKTGESQDKVTEGGKDKSKPVALPDEAFGSGKKPDSPIDIYVADFHHNISLERNVYRTEDLQLQVDKLFDSGLVSSRFTVAIDCTIDFIRSEDIRKFLEHNEKRIKDGDMNVVLYRSAQKFDMLGLDNYYGGFTVTINNGESYDDFNQRMDDAEDQVSGLAMQGMSHLSQTATTHSDRYRQALMDSTRLLYNSLPPQCIFAPNSTSPMQISKVEDPHSVFLDIKFPAVQDDSKATLISKAFSKQIFAYAAANGLPLTGRASFGFPTTNYTVIGGSKVRLNPGLEGPQVTKAYADFFALVHNALIKAQNVAQATGLSQDDLETKLVEAMNAVL